MLESYLELLWTSLSLVKACW